MFWRWFSGLTFAVSIVLGQTSPWAWGETAPGEVQALHLWEGRVVAKTTGGDVYMNENGAWVRKLSGGVKALAVGGSHVFVADDTRVARYDRAFRKTGEWPLTGPLWDLAASQTTVFAGWFAAEGLPWTVAVEAWDYQGKRLWSQRCAAPPNEAENTLLQSALPLHKAVVPVFRLLAVGDTVWAAYPRRNLFVEVKKEGCRAVRWTSPRWAMDPEENRWQRRGLPAPFPLGHLRAVAVNETKGFVLVPEFPLQRFVAWVDFDGQVRGGKRVLPQHDLALAMAAEGDTVVVYTDKGELHRWRWDELFPEVRP